MRRTKADIIADVLRRDFPSGVVDPREALKLARDPRHELHNELEWDDKRAGAIYRLQQMEGLIRMARMKITRGAEIREVPMCLHRANGSQTYMLVTEFQPIDVPPKLLEEVRQTRGHVRRLSEVAFALGFDSSVHDQYVGVLDKLAAEMQMALPPARKRRVKGKAGKDRARSGGARLGQSGLGKAGKRPHGQARHRHAGHGKAGQ